VDPVPASDITETISCRNPRTEPKVSSGYARYTDSSGDCLEYETVADTGQSPVSSFLVIKCRETGADVGAVVIGVQCSAAPIAWCEVE